MSKSVWIFGYGSLIWRPDFAYLRKEVASLAGYTRRFWQGSHDHRGTPDAPGRVVTLIEEPQASCLGVAYLLDQETITATFEQLDYREKNGYERLEVSLTLQPGETVPALVYIATPGNFAYLGPAADDDIARQIAVSTGPSGRNIDYLTDLAASLKAIGADDPHVFELAAKASLHNPQRSR